MHRIDTPNRALNLWGAGKDGWRDGNKAAGINPTEFNAAMMNTLQEEFAGLVEFTGQTLDPNNNAQVLLAIEKLIEARSGNYALDTGVANAYVVALNPAITAYGDGMTVRVKAVNANNGASTLNAGVGAVALNNDVGGALAGSDVLANDVFEATYIAASNEFRITSMVRSQGDARYAQLGQIIGKNKLLNTTFENPINQRVKASRVTTAGAYNFDCWYYGSDTKFYQAADYLNLSASQQYTLNWSGTATAEYLFSTARSTAIEAQPGWTAIAKGAQITAPADVITGAKFLWIRWAGVTAALTTLDKPQLEEGAIATTYERKLYADRLRDCQGYLPYWGNPTPNNGSIGDATCNSATNTRLTLKLPAPVRFPVTGVIYSNLAHFTRWGGTGTVSAIAVSAYASSDKQVTLDFTVTGNTAGDSDFVSINGNANAFLYLTGGEI